MDEHYEVRNRRQRRSQPLDPGNLHTVSPVKDAILVSLALLIALPAFAQDARAPTPVRLGDVYADSLGSEDVHAYAMELKLMKRDGEFRVTYARYQRVAPGLAIGL